MQRNSPVEYDTFMAWPNGAGETPCTSAYLNAAETQEDAERLASEAEDAEDWATYQAESARGEAARELAQRLRDEGHVGAAITYGQVIPAMAMLGGACVTADGRVFNREHFVGQL